jgi:hypothetical protein
MSAEQKHTPEELRDISEKVYRELLGPSDVASMIEKDKDDGQKLRGRAAGYDRLTRAYLKVLGATGAQS